MRQSLKGQAINNSVQLSLDTEFHRFLEKEQAQSNIEFVEEFGISVHEVRHLKKKLSR
jgi:hypothetical protein